MLDISVTDIREGNEKQSPEKGLTSSSQTLLCLTDRNWCVRVIFLFFYIWLSTNIAELYKGWMECNVCTRARVTVLCKQNMCSPCNSTSPVCIIV